MDTTRAKLGHSLPRSTIQSDGLRPANPQTAGAEDLALGLLGCYDTRPAANHRAETADSGGTFPASTSRIVYALAGEGSRAQVGLHSARA